MAGGIFCNKFRHHAYRSATLMAKKAVVVMQC